MNVKIDTKEKFSVLTPEAAAISANMTEDMRKLGDYVTTVRPHLVVNLKNVFDMAPEAAEALAALHEDFYGREHSFVICEIQPAVKKVFEETEVTERLNITPTESEAWDIVQMEEVERELMRDFDEEQ